MTSERSPGRTSDSAPRAKRAYQTVGVKEQGGLFHILLDGKPARTPMKRALATPSPSLAEAVAGEWQAQGATIIPSSMPMTRLLATAIDRVGPGRAAVIAALMAHVHADALCYRAEHPADLRLRQEQHWQPVLRWVEEVHGVALAPVSGVMPAAQTPETVARLEALIGALDDVRLTAFQACAGATGSLALAMALVGGRLSADAIFAAAALDETYQMEHWGADPIAVARRQGIAADISAAAQFLKLAV